MKPSAFLACAAALVAIAGCNSKPGDAATNTPLDVKPIAAPKGGDWTQVVTQTPEGGFAMSRMHRLYGVTMIEKGVSRLVSVDLGAAETLLAAE